MSRGKISERADAFAFTPDPAIPVGETVTATATKGNGCTSEFSAAVPVT